MKRNKLILVWIMILGSAIVANAGVAKVTYRVVSIAGVNNWVKVSKAVYKGTKKTSHVVKKVIW